MSQWIRPFSLLVGGFPTKHGIDPKLTIWLPCSANRLGTSPKIGLSLCSRTGTPFANPLVDLGSKAWALALPCPTEDLPIQQILPSVLEHYPSQDLVLQAYGLPSLDNPRMWKRYTCKDLTLDGIYTPVEWLLFHNLGVLLCSVA